MTTMYYKGYGDIDSQCEVAVIGDLAIVTQTDANTGTSITNKASWIAEQICVEHYIDRDKLVCIHHYDKTCYRSGRERWQLVQFNVLDKPISHSGGDQLTHFTSPRFTTITKELAQALANSQCTGGAEFNL